MFRTGFPFFFLMWIFIFPAVAMAIAPPRVIEERNLEAEFILIGEVITVNGESTPPHFVLKVNHVIKGCKKIKIGDRIKILFKPPPSKTADIARHVQGILPVKAEAGNVVVVYINCSESLPGYFRPILEGLSVITL